MSEKTMMERSAAERLKAMHSILHEIRVTYEILIDVLADFDNLNNHEKEYVSQLKTLIETARRDAYLIASAADKLK